MIIRSIATLVMGVSLCAYAWTAEPNRARSAHTPIERAVEARSRAWIKSEIDGDADAFRTFATDDYVLMYVDPKTAEHPARWATTTREEWAASLRSGQKKYHSVTLWNTNVRVNGDVALFSGEYTEKGVRDGTEYTESGFFLETWVNRHGQWMAVSSVFP